MPLDEIDRIAVLGAGAMGHGIAEVAALAGYEVTLRDVDEAMLDDGYDEIEWSLDKLVEHGRIDDDTAQATLARIDPILEIETALEDVDYVIEAVPERMEIKRDVFEDVSRHAPADAIFATNTSSLSISEIATATDRPERFCGMHFFNPPVRMDLVEVIAGDETDETTLEVTERLAEDMGKTPVRVAKDVPGFIANRLLTPLMNEACWMVESGETSIGAIDATATFELGLPMGAFELADYVGLDVILDVLEYIHDELGDAYRPCPILEDKVDDGRLGKKTGEGFYDYENGGATTSQSERDPEIAERLIAVMANEAAKLVGDDVATPAAIDTAIELGAGFPEGPTRMADAHGLDRVVEHLDRRAEETDADRYLVADELRDLAEGGGFHGGGDAQTTDAFEELQVDYPGEHLARITLDRPHRMNAISPTVLEELPKAIEAVEDEDDVRAILLVGAGDRAFSAGADIGGMANVWGGIEEAVALSRQGQTVCGRLQETDLPVIAAIDGYCLGGGMELATAADLRIATERSTFGQPERDLGLLPGWGGTQRLVPIVGFGRAKEIVFSGDEYEAIEMADFGFVNELFEAEDFEEAAVEYAEAIASGPPIALGYAKRALNMAVQEDTAGLEVEATAFGRLTETDDFAEGISAFLEDREPDFDGS